MSTQETVCSFFDAKISLHYSDLEYKNIYKFSETLLLSCAFYLCKGMLYVTNL